MTYMLALCLPHCGVSSVKPGTSLSPKCPECRGHSVVLGEGKNERRLTGRCGPCSFTLLPLCEVLGQFSVVVPRLPAEGGVQPGGCPWRSGEHDLQFPLGTTRCRSHHTRTPSVGLQNRGRSGRGKSHLRATNKLSRLPLVLTSARSAPSRTRQV